MPVLWICGPAGVGKTTAAWHICSGLRAAGAAAAFADIDQLGMCYPESPADPGRHRMKTRNLGAVLGTYRAAGAQCAIVSGVTDPAGVDATLLPGRALTIVRLTASPAEIIRRFTRRNQAASDEIAEIKDTLDEAAVLDASSFADVIVDTSDVRAGQVPDLIRQRCRDWPGFQPGLLADIRPEPIVTPAASPGGRVLLLCGPTGAGKSAIGFQLYMRTLDSGRTAGYVDLDQVGFFGPQAQPGDLGRHMLKARNLAEMWRTYRSAGASHLVAVGPVENEAAAAVYADALQAATVTLCRLTAGADELARRLLTRRTGGSWPQPGDPLAGQPEAALRLLARQAAAEVSAQAPGIPIDTDGRSVAESADLVAAAAGWPREPVR